MKNTFDFTGTGVALATPFKHNKEVDFDALDKLVNHAIKGKVEYLVILGTTGETPVLSKEEKHAIKNRVVEITNNSIPLVLGIGGNNTQCIVNDLKSTDLTGISGILSVAPYYNKPSQDGIYEHFKAVCSASELPVIIYNVPGRTGVNIKAKTTLNMARDFKNAVAIKEASGNMEQIMEIIAKKPNGFKVLSGDDALTYSMLMLGGDGVISVVANACPEDFSTMVRYAIQGNKKEALQLHYKLLPVMNYLFEEGSPTGLKAALHILGITENELRLPLVKASEKLYNKIKSEIK